MGSVFWLAGLFVAQLTPEPQQLPCLSFPAHRTELPLLLVLRVRILRFINTFCLVGSGMAQNCPQDSPFVLPAPSTGTVTPLVTAGLAQAGLLVAFLATWATWHGQQPQHFEQESVLLGEASQEKVGTTRTFTCVGKIRHILLVHLPGALELRHGDTCNSKDKTGHGLGQINNLRRSMSQRASGRVPGHGSGTSARRESRKDEGERRSTRPCTLTNTFLHI